MKKEEKEAFPYSYEYYKNGQHNIVVKDGMSKRFYAACAAMQGLLANPNPDMVRMDAKSVADMAYKHADELLSQE